MRIATWFRAAALLWAASLTAQTRDIPFESNVLHVGNKTDMVAADHRVELRRGTVLFHVEDSGAPPVEIATPSVTVHPYFLGDYKVEVKSGETIITPVGGDVKVSSPLGDEWVPVGKRMIARGPASNPQFKIVSAKTGWRWVAEMLAAVMRNTGGGVSVDAGGSNDDSSHQSSKPAATQESHTSRPSEPVGHNDTHVATSPGRGK